MMKDNFDINLAKMFKSRENKEMIGNIIGKVVSTSPDLKISVLDGSIILDKEQLYCCNHVLKDYTRQYEKTGTIQLYDTNCGNTNIVNDGGYEANDHQHIITDINIDTSYTAQGEITFKDTLKINDEVLLLHTTDEQIWFIVDKITKL
ncbi:DUF2577 family protein [Wukongibacter sp. M2B1]|uniref:DUF2577 family protein n=1 Tax=Wukongibacter sp. M2B1 TaxID=3088895 RepID=UPI003D792DB8